MNRLLAIFIAIILTAWTQLKADNQYLQRLDSAISERPHIMAAKEKRLSELRSSIAVQPKKEKRLEMYEQMYQEYLTYRYDSALVYAQRSLNLSKELGNATYYQRAIINYALLDARGGFYSEAYDYLKNINPEELNDSLKYEYYITHFWLYLYWTQYSSDGQITQL